MSEVIRRRQPQFVRDSSGLWLPRPIRGGAPDSVTIYPSAAVYIAEAMPTTNYNSGLNAANLIIKRATGSKLGEDKYVALIRCNLLDEGIPAGSTILGTSAFHFYVSSIYAYGDTELWVWHRGYYLSGGSPWYPWDEDTVVWNSLGGFMGAPYAVFLYPRSTGWNSVDDGDCSGSLDLISEVLQYALDTGHEHGDPGDLDMCLFPGVCNELVGFIFDSETGTHPPYLVVDYTPPSAGAAFGTIPTDTLVPASWAGGARRFGAVPSTEVVTVGSGARRWGAVPSDELVPADSDWTT